jgi:hypothetical protein
MLTPFRSKITDLVASVILLIAKPGGASTTLSGNAAAGATLLALTSATGFGDLDAIAVGSEEDAELVVQTGAASGNNVNLFAPGLKRAHVATEAVRELIAYDLGNVVQVRRTDSAVVANNEPDTQRNPDGVRMGHLKNGIGFQLQGYSPEHYALLTGIPVASVLGAGTAADPTQLHTDGEDFTSDQRWLVATERLKDGTFRRHEWDACDADYTGITIPFGQGRETLLQAMFAGANHGRQATVAPQFTIDYTRQVKKAAQIEAMIEAGWFRVLSGGLATTLTGPIAKGANVFALTAATGVAGGKYYLVTGGGKSQIVLAQSLSVLNMTARTRAAYAFPTGSTVTELEQVVFAGLKEGTTEFRTGGAMRDVKFDNQRAQSGLMAGSALFTFAYQPTAATLETLRLMKALPTSVISGSVLTESDLAGSDTPVGTWIIGTGIDNALESLEIAFGKNEITGQPLALRAQLQSQLMW